MTPQETFDAVARALVHQGAPSVDYSGRCSYRAQNGNRCAVGHLVPDELYTAGMENFAAGQPPVSGILARLGIDIVLARDLQTAHDTARRYDIEAWRADWEAKMRDIAAIYRLSTAALEEALAAREAAEA